jgi:hypothetical protein
VLSLLGVKCVLRVRKIEFQTNLGLKLYVTLETLDFIDQSGVTTF